MLGLSKINTFLYTFLESPTSWSSSVSLTQRWYSMLHIKSGQSKITPSSSSESPSTSEILEIFDLEDSSHYYSEDDRPTSAKSSSFSTSDYSGKIDPSTSESSSSKTYDNDTEYPIEPPCDPVIRRRFFRSIQVSPSGDGPPSSPSVRVHMSARSPNFKLRCTLESSVCPFPEETLQTEPPPECTASQAVSNTKFKYLGTTQYLGQQAYEKGNDGDIYERETNMNLHIRVFNPNASPPIWGTVVHHFHVDPNEALTDLVNTLRQKEGISDESGRLEYIPYPGRVIHVEANSTARIQGIPSNAVMYFYHRLQLPPSSKTRSQATTTRFLNFANSSLTEVST